MPRKKNIIDAARVGVRDALRAKWQHRADRWGLMPGCPYPRLLAKLDAGETVLVTYVDLLGTGTAARRGVRYLLHADGTLTEDHYIDQPAAVPARD
ncbi:hypothetical protein NY537_10475 [Curtobacterium flaccumfaciens pv. betae]|uniref:hypothetical protein n=1 Tax=Curtobacterium flaccumfaciens TaxID=2035 RepID=UPI0026587B43|nr:hypothetical protein [Curtobacterium flaccumfaciens]MCS5513166.1 hypothetical protein [Curtobacterium flaccumfaciens pv. betae]